MAAAYIGGSHLPRGLNRIINHGDFSKDYGAGFIGDDHLLEIWHAYDTQATYDSEHAHAVLDYIYDNVYFYPTIVRYTVLVTSKVVDEIFFQPGSVTYWINASSFNAQ